MSSAHVPAAIEGFLARTDRDFEQVVKDALDRPRLDPAFRAAFLERLRGRRVTNVALAWMVLDSPAAWGDLRAACVESLVARAHDAVSVLAMLPTQLEDWPPVETVSTSSSGPPHAPRFDVALRLAPPDREAPLEGRASGRTRREAEQRASVVLLAHLAEVPPPAFEEPAARPAPPPEAVVTLPAEFSREDPLTVLNNLAQRTHRKRPVYQHRRVDDVTESTCRFDGRATVARAELKKDADRAAARLMLAALSAPAPIAPAVTSIVVAETP